MSLNGAECGRGRGAKRPPEGIILDMILGILEERAVEQGKAKCLMYIYRSAFGKVMECAGAAERMPTDGSLADMAADTMFHAHAGLVALTRLTGSDEVLAWLRPMMVKYSKKPDFRRVAAAEAMYHGIPYADMTPERYGWIVDGVAYQMLRQAGAPPKNAN